MHRFPRAAIGAVVVMALCGLLLAPSANAKTSSSYYPGTPLGPMGSKAEDAKCAASNLCTGEDKDGDGRYDYLKPAGATTSTKKVVTSSEKPVTATKPATTATKTVVKPTTTGAGITEKAYLTGYSMEDNTPRNSREISDPSVHKQAGGKGTYADPITVAVGHSIDPTLIKFKPGTRFYVPEVRAYFVVEDTCGDGDHPQDGGCWTGYPKGAQYWIDLYVGSDPDDKCMDAITGIHTVIRNPDAGYLAVARKGDVGSIYYGLGSNCTVYNDTPARASTSAVAK